MRFLSQHRMLVVTPVTLQMGKSDGSISDALEGQRVPFQLLKLSIVEIRKLPQVSFSSVRERNKP